MEECVRDEDYQEHADGIEDRYERQHLLALEARGAEHADAEHVRKRENNTDGSPLTGPTSRKNATALNLGNQDIRR